MLFLTSFSCTNPFLPPYVLQNKNTDKVYGEFNDCAILHLNAGTSVSSPTEKFPSPMKAARRGLLANI